MNNTLLSLLQKYDVPTPRYTSYPTVPYWKPETLNLDTWKQRVVQTFENENGEICLYLHLPFCEELCTYCACNKRITKNHAVEEPYLKSLLAEWNLYRALFTRTPVIREIHLGGGTPTFFSPENLKALITAITEGCDIAPNHEFSVEVHPNFTSREHLEALHSVGFNRISLGVQDMNPEVQFIINRIQPFEKTKEVIDIARELGYFSVNLDLIYGLPRQTLESIEFTLSKVKELMPDRIAFYSYAHVPWKSKGQRRYTDEDVPGAAEKLAMYTRGNELLEQMGYISIGMDHFALPSDKLLLAFEKGELHRNFMGYTTTNHKLVIGLGASSISDTWTAFAQNEKTVEDYQQKLANGEWPIVVGHDLSAEDLIIRRHVLDLMCKDETLLDAALFDTARMQHVQDKLAMPIADNLAVLHDHTLKITAKGKLFVRIICAAIDAYLYHSTTEKNMFSKAI